MVATYKDTCLHNQKKDCDCYEDDKLRKEEKTPRERGKQKKALRLREQSTNDTGNSNSNDQQDTTTIEKGDIEDIPDEQDHVWAPDSPIYVPPATFSSPDVSDDVTTTR